MKTGSLIEELRSVQVQVAKRGQDEIAFGNPYDVCKVLPIVGSEANDGSVTVDFCKHRFQCPGREIGARTVIADQ